VAQETRDETALAVTSKLDAVMRRAAEFDLSDAKSYASTGAVRIPFGDGTYWIEIKEELDFGEQTILDNASVVGVQRDALNEASGEGGGQTVRLDLTKHRFLQCAIWLLRWNIPPDENGKPIRLPRHINDRITTLKSLSSKVGDAIVAVIAEYIVSQQEDEEEAQAKQDKHAEIDEDGDDEGTDEIPPAHSQNGAHVVAATSSQF
jgi:pimeloyl-CoA synthetase